MIYFDNAATGGFKPDGVIGATYAAIKTCANPGRSGHRLSLACAERVFAVRLAMCEFFGASSPDRVIFTKNCTEALNIAILGCLKAGDRVVSTVAEHNSVLRPLNYLKAKGVEVELAPLNGNGCVDIGVLAELSNRDGGAKAVIVTLASNVTGAEVDIARVRSLIPAKTYLICDGAQACGHVPIDVSACGIDALAVAGHKGMLAIQGSGALVFSERFNPDPITFGGTGSESFNLNMPDFYPDRLESGTLSYPAIVSLGEGVLYLKSHFYENRDKVLHLTGKLYDGLAVQEGVKLYSRPNPYGIIAFSLDGMQSETVASRLSEEFYVCVRGGLHCAPLMHKALHSDGLVRVSLSPANSETEIEYFLSAIKKLCEN